MLYVNPVATQYSAGLNSLAESGGREKAAFEEFEQFFLFTLLREMRKSIPHEGIWGDGAERKVYEEMLDDAYSRQMAQCGQFGLARSMADQLRVAELQNRLSPTTDVPSAEVKS
jgi:Rod binding domain-containing protein